MATPHTILSLTNYRPVPTIWFSHFVPCRLAPKRSCHVVSRCQVWFGRAIDDTIWSIQVSRRANIYFNAAFQRVLGLVHAEQCIYIKHLGETAFDFCSEVLSLFFSPRCIYLSVYVYCVTSLMKIYILFFLLLCKCIISYTTSRLISKAIKLGLVYNQI